LVEVSAPNQTGLEELWAAVVSCREELGAAAIEARRQGGLEREAVAAAATRAGARAQHAMDQNPAIQAALAQLHAGTLDPLALAQLLERHTGRDA
ncbi:MAG: hypothetical protein JHD05_05485, partial [Thermoleophilia bacterium]|nr:hypothetical protein [Thermoleophilia bacterium]